ncbi:M48 family metallopeptidase [uncultured Acinetobacter sp.]|uniref:M48 family metallopeptidase n=1 Tax=uncultured Acinetobacter sp. TaxID=165433 RepID=UPI00261FB1B7|nr:SprT family zinc-dependent metalloprotease [uncultured Acinetobacter sp.]
MLPDIQIRRSARAKRLTLRVHPHQICLTVPMACSEQNIQAFIASSQTWLQQAWQKQQHLQTQLPNCIRLFNQSQAILIVYQVQAKLFIFKDQQLYVDQAQPQAALKAFSFAYAKQYLPQFLHSISQEIGLNYQSCTIRQAKTRWGSCSSVQNIMLSSALVFCDARLVRYVCIHELCHTRYMHHGTLFWQLLEQFDPLYAQHQSQLKRQQPYAFG